MASAWPLQPPAGSLEELVASAVAQDWPKKRKRAPGKSPKCPYPLLARPSGFEPLAFGFVEDIHVSSNTCKDVQACANAGSVSDEKSKNVQTHASLSKDFAGSLLDAGPPESEVRPRMQPLLSVRQVGGPPRRMRRDGLPDVRAGGAPAL